MWVKICGITRLEDAVAAARFGADAVGFVFAESPRGIAPDEARLISRRMPSGPARVGVFVDTPVQDILDVIDHCGLDLAQLHGGEGRAHLEALGESAIKAVGVKGLEDVVRASRYPCRYLLFDGCRTDGGSHRKGSFDWRLLRALEGDKRVILAGGLTPENVGQAVRTARPFGVDVSSGVECSAGRKDPVLMYRFIEAAKKTHYEVQNAGF
jgi:phosphoribosylanthranilate isomerase